MTESLHDRVVAAIGRAYELEDEIGRGGMSVVFRARDLRLNRPVAIKVLPPELAHDAAIRARFTREAQTSAQLVHPHIVPIYDVGERDGIACFVMALVTGGNLAHAPDAASRGSRSTKCAAFSARSPTRSRTRTCAVSSTATSSRTTSCSIARRPRDGHRLRHRVGHGSRRAPDGDRDRRRHADVHVAGAGGRRARARRPERHLLARRTRLPDADGTRAVRGGNSMALLLKHVTERPRRSPSCVPTRRGRCARRSSAR